MSSLQTPLFCEWKGTSAYVRAGRDFANFPFSLQNPAIQHHSWRFLNHQEQLLKVWGTAGGGKGG